MSTRCSITYKTPEGKFVGIYCHNDGYLDGVGQVLLDHYRDPAKVAELIALGDISSLGERVKPEGAHTFEKPEEGTTVAYHRDRGEPLSPPCTGATAREVTRQIDGGYKYVFVDGEWTIGCKPLAQAIQEGN